MKIFKNQYNFIKYLNGVKNLFLFTKFIFLSIVLNNFKYFELKLIKIFQKKLLILIICK